MNTPLKPSQKPQKSLKEDIFNHLDFIYQSALHSKNFALALKVVEACIKAKQAASKHQVPMISIKEMSDEDLEKLVQSLQHPE